MNNLEQLGISIQSKLLFPFEYILRQKAAADADVIPVWIIGVPRSGTTLAYQLMCASFRSTYLTNRVAKRYRIALASRAIERLLFERKLHPQTFQSNFGRTISNNDPHEGGAFFYQFLPSEEPYVEATDLTTDEKIAFKSVISSLTYPRKLFISKNTVHSLRIKALADIFPNSKFLWVTRNKNDAIKSMLKARKANGILENQWWSVKPPGWIGRLDQSPDEMVAWQYSEINHIINQDLQTTNAEFYKVSYEDICKQPLDEIINISKGLKIEPFMEDMTHLSERLNSSIIK